MADSHPFANAGLGMFGSAERSYASSAMANQLAQKNDGNSNPISTALGDFLYKLSGGFKTESPAGSVSPQGALGQGISLQSSPVIPPNGGLGLDQPQNLFQSYQPQQGMPAQQTPQPSQQVQPQTMLQPVDSWSNRAFGGFKLPGVQ